MSQFASLSLSDNVQPNVTPRKETIRMLFEQINWNEMIKNEVLRQRDYQVLVRAQENLEFTLDNTNDAVELGRILMKISGNPNDVLVTKYAFFLTEEILGLSGDYSIARGGAVGKNIAHIFTFGNMYLNDGSLVKALSCQDVAIQRSAGLIFAHLLNLYEGSSDRLKDWIISKLISSTEGVWESAMPALTTYLRGSTARKNSLIEAGAVQNIATIFRNLDIKQNTQQVYELCFILWTLSLGEVEMSAFLASGIIPVLVDLLTAAPTRKVTRMTLATLKNLSVSEDDAVLNEMFTATLPKVLDTMHHNHFLKTAADDEVESDFKFLQEVLARNFRELSSYERWASQVQSGSLRWGILHTEKFWRENAKFVEHDNFKSLKTLIHHLESKDPAVVCVALYDLGEFTRFYPNGRVVVSRLGAKDKVIQMMESDNAEVQRHTLQCISKIMVNNWEFLR
eukprot:gene13843-15918_t